MSEEEEYRQTLDGAQEAFEDTPTKATAANLLTVATRYWDDDMISDETYFGEVASVSAWLSGGVTDGKNGPFAALDVPESVSTNWRLGVPEDCRSYDFEFGLDEGNRLGYVSVTIWPSRNTDGLRDRRLALTKRLARMVETDPECQRLLIQERHATRDEDL